MRLLGTPNVPRCGFCGSAVYATEQIRLNGFTYHRRCLKCSHPNCGLLLSLTNVHSFSGHLLCQTHYKEALAGRGSVELDATPRTIRSPSLPTEESARVVDDLDLVAAEQFDLRYDASHSGSSHKLLAAPPAASSTGQAPSVLLKDVADAKVYLLFPLGSVSIVGCTGCDLVLGPSNGLCYVRNCRNVTLTVGCHRIRVRDSSQLKVFVLTPSDPMVETSWDITFAPWNAAWPGLDWDFGKARLDPLTNRYARIYDLNEGDAQIPDTHWQIIEEDEYRVREFPNEARNGGKIENPCLLLNGERYGSAREGVDRDAQASAPQRPRPAVSLDALHRALFNELDAAEEHQMVQRTESLRRLDQLLMMRNPRTRRRNDASMESIMSEQSEETEESDIPVPSDYTGPRVPPFNAPPTVAQTKELLASFSAGVRLHKRYVVRILGQFTRLYDAQPNVVELKLEPDETMNVVGDLHGQHLDALTILQKHGYPSRHNQYIFNGDFVDRGVMGVEVFLTLAALKLTSPDHVHLNRGNHEARPIAEQYGFLDEVMHKYDAETYEYFMSAFNVLPIAHVVDSDHVGPGERKPDDFDDPSYGCHRGSGRGVFVVHGGLCRKNDILLSHMNAIDRRVDNPTDDPIFQDLLWSDPQPEPGRSQNPRGRGIMFGPGVTKWHLIDNWLGLVIRSHQVVDDGYEVAHNGKCITVFSASNYAGAYDNKGAVVSFCGADLEPSFHQFVAGDIDITFVDTAHAMAAVNTKQLRREEKETLSSTNLTLIQKLIGEHSMLLLEHFSNKYSNDATVTLSQWANGMAQTIQGHIPWLTLRPMIVDVEADGLSVNWRAFLHHYQVATSPEFREWEGKVIQLIQRRIFAQQMSLADAFRRMDVNNDGSISYEEFSKALAEFDIGLSVTQVAQLMHSLDTDHDGQISFDEFTQIELQFTGAGPSGMSDADKAFCKDVLQELGRDILARSESLAQAFTRVDLNDDGVLTREELRQALAEAIAKAGREPLSKEKLDQVVTFLDTDGNGTIDFAEFVASFQLVNPSLAASMGDMASHVAKVLYTNRTSLKHSFAYFDSDRSGCITRAEFTEGLLAFNDHLDNKLGDGEIEALLESADVQGEKVDYLAFCGSFSA